jgi:hypothetical protein
MQPNHWGPSLWRSIHYVALGYPGDTIADADTRDAYIMFFKNLWYVIPCLKCAANYKRHIVYEMPPIEGFMESGKTLFEWTVALHNLVNRELKKREWTYEEALEHYTKDPKAVTEKAYFKYLVMLFISLVILMAIFALQR